MLRQRLYFGLLPLLFLVIAIGAAAIWTCDRLAGHVKNDLVPTIEAFIACENMRNAANRIESGVPAAARDGDRAKAEQILDVNRTAFQQALIGETGRSAGDRRDFVTAIDSKFQRLDGLEKRVVDAGVPDAAPIVGSTVGASIEVSQAIDKLEQFDFRMAQAIEASAERLRATTDRVFEGAIAAAFFLSIVLAWRLAASLLGPVQALTVSAVALGDGEWDRPVPELSNDELGQLARAFNGMAGNLRAYRDATDAKVLRAQRTMQATINSTPDPLFIVDRDGGLEVRNPAAEALAATPALSRGFPPPVEKALGEVLATGRHFLPTGYDQLVTLRVGREDRHYLPRILAIGDALTGFGGAAVLLQDVTKFRLLDDAKNNLVGTVSHELKTPLTSLRMAVYLLLERNLGKINPQQRELLETARDDADRLLRILNDLLDLARLEGGVAQLNREEVDVAGLLEEMAHEFRGIAEAQRQTIEIQAAPGLTRVSVDRDRIRHVFINLLGNASKYSPEGSAITLYAEPADSGFVRCGVRDRGPGIPPESQVRIFDKFYRLPGQQRKGAGLGLAIAREIVVAHGGSIACASRPGGGSDFHFHLPGNTFVPGATMD